MTMPLMSHVSLGTNDLPRALAFYDAVLGAIGGRRIVEQPGVTVAYGRQAPEFWVTRPIDGGEAKAANGVHFAFMVANEDEVRAFYEAALKAGARPDGEPGPRSDYTAAYYGCFLRDPDGHKIEAHSWDESKAASA